MGRLRGPVLAAGLATMLAGCGGGEPAPAAPTSSKPAATSAKASSAGKAPAKPTPTSEAPPTTSTLGPFPPILSTSKAGVDAAAIRSLADLPAAFQCLPQVTPIQVPSAGEDLAHVICPSALAGKEALYLWHVGSPDDRYRALAGALRKAKYVRGGPNWVAGGNLDKTMGSVGGDVYR